MEQFMNKIKSYTGTIDNYDNKYIAAGISLLLVMYASYATPKIHPMIIKIFDNILFKILVLFAVLYINLKYSPTVSIVVAIVITTLFATMNTLKNTNEHMASIVGNHLDGVPEYTYKVCGNAPHVVLNEGNNVVGEHGEIIENEEPITGVSDEDMKSLCMHIKKDINATDTMETSSGVSELFNSKEACDFASHQYKTIIPDVKCPEHVDSHMTKYSDLAPI